MTPVPATNVYESVQIGNRNNDLIGFLDQMSFNVGTASWLGQLLGIEHEEAGSFEIRPAHPSTAELISGAPSTGIECAFGLYVIPAQYEMFGDKPREEWRMQARFPQYASSRLRLLPLGMTTCLFETNVDAERALSSVPTTAAQRQEREATSQLAREIESLVPDLSEADLGRLVGVSRIAWRDWASGARVARRTSRQRLLRLRRILELRRRVDAESALSHWLDTPFGTNLDTTPARLLSEGRDQLVAILAARSRAPEDDDLVLSAGTDAGGLIDLESVDREFADDRALYSDDQPEDEGV